MRLAFFRNAPARSGSVITGLNRTVPQLWLTLLCYRPPNLDAVYTFTFGRSYRRGRMQILFLPSDGAFGRVFVTGQIIRFGEVRCGLPSPNRTVERQKPLLASYYSLPSLECIFNPSDKTWYLCTILYHIQYIIRLTRGQCREY